MKIIAFAAALAWAAPASSSVNRWSAEIAEASARFDIPADWIRRVMRAESGGKLRVHGRNLVSSAGAMGLMQLMPATWREMSARFGLGSDPFEPRDNILAGTAYLRLMYDRFGYPGVFAAYNAGPARYASALAGAKLPLETRLYVARVAGPGSKPFARPMQSSPLFVAASAMGRSRPQRAKSPALFVPLSSGAF